MDETWIGDRMQKILMSSKIHRAVVTDSNLKYVGSITVDGYLMDQAGMVEFEQVHVVDIESDSRFITYLIRGDERSGIICVNGAAARLVQTGDHIIILGYAALDTAELDTFQPLIVHVDNSNSIVKI
jgi:aspartate 1-decarboxylase